MLPEVISYEQTLMLVFAALGVVVWKIAGAWRPLSIPGRQATNGNMQVWTQIELKSEDRQLIRELCREIGSLRNAVHELREPLASLAKELEYSGRARGERRGP